MKKQWKQSRIAAATLLTAGIAAGPTVMAQEAAPTTPSTPPAPATPPATQKTEGIQAGFLTCNVGSGWGFVIGSSRKLRCVWEPTKGKVYNYYGEVNQFGADIGYHRSSVLLWTVVDATRDENGKSLVGTYGGATAQASLGVGAGASALVGGFKNSITLQPLAISGETGINAAAGIQALTLKEARQEAPSRPSTTVGDKSGESSGQQ